MYADRRKEEPVSFRCSRRRLANPVSSYDKSFSRGEAALVDWVLFTYRMYTGDTPPLKRDMHRRLASWLVHWLVFSRGVPYLTPHLDSVDRVRSGWECVNNDMVAVMLFRFCPNRHERSACGDNPRLSGGEGHSLFGWYKYKCLA